MFKDSTFTISTRFTIPLACLVAVLFTMMLFQYGETQSTPQEQPSTGNSSAYLPIIADGKQEKKASTNAPAGTIFSNSALECGTTSSPITVTIPQWNSNSGWLDLTSDPAIVAVEVVVVSGGAGNMIHLVENWGPVIATEEVAAGTVIVDMPASADISAGIQFYIEHAQGTPYEAVVSTCIESTNPPTNTPTHTPTSTPITNPPTKTPTPTGTPVTPPTNTPTPSLPGGADCSLTPDTTNITLSASEWGSNWKSLAEDSSLRSQINAVELTINSTGGAGNRARIYENWSQPAIAEVTLPNGPAVVMVPLPSNSNARLEIQIANNSLVATDIDMMLCNGTGPPTPIPPANGMPKTDPNGVPVPGQTSGLPLSQGFGDWANHPGVAGTLSTTCVDLHDSYWVEGDDGKAYHTWHPSGVFHPVTQEGCVFGHEHGNDPSSSALFEYSGGWPAFGFALEQFNSTLPAGVGPREEDHVGHKVTVARYRAAIGNPPNTDEAIYDAGFNCDFMSKIHQGSHSNDAFVNHLHEYNLNVACDDTPNNPGTGNIRTKFSLKVMLPFGEPNEFNNMCFGNIVQAANSVTGLTGQLLPIAQVLSPTPAIGSNPREFMCVQPDQGRFKYGTVDYFNQFDLWTQLNEVNGPENLKVNFQSYYVIKDSGRGYDNSSFNGGQPSNTESLRYTVDLCEKYQAENLKFCEKLFAQNNGVAPSPYSTSSTFRGALRAVNFKIFPLYNNSTARSGDEFCTDPNGNYTSLPTNGSCPAGQILQKIANSFSGNNNWWSWTNPATGKTGPVTGSLSVEGQPVLYPKFDPATNSYSFINGLQQPDANGNGCPYGPVSLGQGASGAYCPVGIGFEKIVDMRNSVPQAVKDAVQINPATGQQYNTDLHAPN